MRQRHHTNEKDEQYKVNTHAFYRVFPLLVNYALQMLHCRSSIATYIVGRDYKSHCGIQYFVDWCITHNSGHERKGTATVHFHLLWPFPRIFLLKKAAPLQLKLGSTCAVHSKTSQVERTTSQHCPTFVWQDWQSLFG